MSLRIRLAAILAVVATLGIAIASIVAFLSTSRELRGELEHQARTFRRDLAEARIGHFGQFAMIARAHPCAAQR